MMEINLSKYIKKYLVENKHLSEEDADSFLRDLEKENASTPEEEIVDPFHDNCQETLYRLDSNISQIFLQRYIDTWTQIKESYITIMTDYQLIVLMSQNEQYLSLSRDFLKHIKTNLPKKFYYYPVANRHILEQYIIKAFHYGVKYWKYELKEDIKYNDISKRDQERIFNSLDFIISHIPYLRQEAEYEREYYWTIINEENSI